MDKESSHSQKYKRGDNKDRRDLRGYEIDVISPFLIKSIPEKDRQLKTFEEFKQDYEKVAEQIELNQNDRFEIKKDEQKKDIEIKMPKLSLNEFATLNTIFYNFDPTKWDKHLTNPYYGGSCLQHNVMRNSQAGW
jgi:hypothetical protein